MRLNKNQRRLIDLGFDLLERQKSRTGEEAEKAAELPKDVALLYKEMRLALFPEAPPKQPKAPTKQPQAAPVDPIEALLSNRN